MNKFIQLITNQPLAGSNGFADIFRMSILSLLLTTVSLNTNAQSVLFKYNGGTTDTYVLADLKQLTFNGNQLKIEMRDGTIYQRSIDEVASFRYNQSTGVQNALENLQNINMKLFPNPTKGTITVSYTLPQNGRVEVSLYNTEGKQLKVLFTGEQLAGEQQFSADLSGLPAGNYLCYIRTDAFAVSKQCTYQP